MIGLKFRHEHQPGECLRRLNAITRPKVPNDVRVGFQKVTNDHKASGGVSGIGRTVLGYNDELTSATPTDSSSAVRYLGTWNSKIRRTRSSCLRATAPCPQDQQRGDVAGCSNASSANSNSAPSVTFRSSAIL